MVSLCRLLEEGRVQEAEAEKHRVEQVGCQKLSQSTLSNRIIQVLARAGIG